MNGHPGHPTPEQGVGRSSRARGLVAAVAGAALVLALAPALASAQPTLFSSIATIRYAGESGGVHFYDFNLASGSLPYHELKLSLDPNTVTPDVTDAVGADARFVSAEVTSHTGVNLWFSTNQRALANMNDMRFLNTGMTDAYNPANTSEFPDPCHEIELRLGLNRQLSASEMYLVGYWGGDFRGMLDETMPFTESDGVPIPEPATLALTLTGLAGLLGAHRRRRSR